MSDVQFEEENKLRTSSRHNFNNSANTGLVGFLIKKNIAKNQKQAGYILIGIAVVAIALAFFVWPTSPDDIENIDTNNDAYLSD